jgi:hypothetical protein
MVLFICGLFNDDFSSLDNIASNVRMIDVLWIGKDMEGSSRGLISELRRHLSVRTLETHENPPQSG